jgi:CAAX prenyl protease-like protein
MNPPARAHDPERLTRAHAYPFVAFMSFMLVLMVLGYAIEWKHPDAPWWRQQPSQLVYPIQTLVCLGFLGYFWRSYTFNWSFKWSLVGIVFGAIGIGFWLLPTTLYDYWKLTETPTNWLGKFGVEERKEGFDPGIFQNALAYWSSLTMRFIRAVIVVALIEEIFWRGFVMRLVCDWEGDYWKQPFGRSRWLSYLIVTGLFMVAHSPTDYAGAFVYGSLTYLLCVWSKNLGACVVMHATANLLMGLYIMAYGKYGLW